MNSADSGTTNEEFSTQYGVLTAFSLPYIRKKENRTILLGPRLSFSLNGQDNDIAGDYFKGVDELSWGNIYSGSKITSLTESEEGFSVSFGIENEIFWKTGNRLGLSIAASRIHNLTYNPNSSFGLTGRKLNYLAKLSYKTKNANSIYVDTHFSSTGQLLKGDLKGRVSNKNLTLLANYEILDQVLDKRLSEDLKAINILSSYKLFEDFALRAGGRYDLTYDQLATTSIGVDFSVGAWTYVLNQQYLKEEREKFSLSAIYDDECTRLTLSFESRYQDLGSSAPVKSLMLRIQLKPFATVVFAQGGDQVTF